MVQVKSDLSNFSDIGLGGGIVHDCLGSDTIVPDEKHLVLHLNRPLLLADFNQNWNGSIF